MGVFCGFVAFYLTIEFLIFKSQCTHIELFFIGFTPIVIGQTIDDSSKCLLFKEINELAPKGFFKSKNGDF